MKLLRATLITSALLSSIQAQSIFQIDTINQPTFEENFYLFGEFQALTNYSSVSKYNLSRSVDSSTSNFYAFTSDNDTIVQLTSDRLTNSGLPNQLYQFESDSFIAIINGEPVIYNTTTQETQEIENWSSRVSGSVETLYVDTTDHLIYFGGDLSFNDTYGAVTYNYNESRFIELPFGGFNKDGFIKSIIKFNNESILFGGNFQSIGYNDLLSFSANQTSNSSSNSTSYVDPDQLISLKYATISTVNSDSATDPESIICPNSDSSNWSLQRNLVGSWSATLPYTVAPSKLRLFNSASNQNGVSLFRVITSPSNGIMNMSYIDPKTLELSYCDAWCPLLENSDLQASIEDNANNGDEAYAIRSEHRDGLLGFGSNYQEFQFYNWLDVETITIQVLDYYGDQATLSGFQLYQYGMYIYANETLNEPSCNTISQYSQSSQLGSLTWSSDVSNGNYLSTTVSASAINPEQGVRFTTNIQTSGEYVVYIFTPGCNADNSCSSRGIVNATFFAGNGTVLGSSLLYQTNEEEKYDVIFDGHILIDGEHSATPYLTLTLYSALYSSEVVFVADSVYVQFVSIDAFQNNTVNYNISINGLLEYSLTNFTDYANGDLDIPIGNSSLNLIGSSILSENATVNGLYLNRSTLFIAGDFQSQYGDNLIAAQLGSYNDTSDSIDVDSEISIDGGLDNVVNGIFDYNDNLILIGDFKSTQDGNNSVAVNQIGIYNGSFYSLTTTSNDLSVESVSFFTYNSTDYLVFNNENGASVYDYSNSIWFNSTDVLNLNISQAIKINEVTYAFGGIFQMDMAIDNGVYIANDTFQSEPSIEFKLGGEIYSSLYLNSSIVFVGGDFETSDGYYENFAYINEDHELIGISNLTFGEPSKVNVLFEYDSVVYVGFQGNASYNNSNYNDLLIYNLNNSEVSSLPGKFSNGVIKVMGLDPEFFDLIIAGNFSSSECDSLCYFSTSNKTISNPSKDSISGSINDLLYFAKYQVLLAGDLRIGSSNNNSSVPFGLFNTQNKTITPVDGLNNNELPGPVTKFQMMTESLTDVIVVMGDSFIGYFNESRYTSIDNDSFNLMNSKFSGFQLLNTTTTTSSTTLIDNKLLLLTGDIQMIEYGNVTSATYDGSKWAPLTIVTNSSINTSLRATKTVFFTADFDTSSSSSSTPSPSPSSSPDKPDLRYFTTGQVVGVGLAAALGTMTVLTLLCFGIYYMSQKNAIVGPLRERVGEEKMMNIVPPGQVISNMDMAKADR